MNKTLIAFLLVAGLFGGVIIGAFGFHNAPQPGFGSTTVNYSNSGGSANLYNSLASIVQDVTAVRTSVAGTSATLVYTVPALGTIGTTTSTASTTITVAGAAIGDFVQVSYTSSTMPVNTVFYAQVGAASSVTVFAQNVGAIAQSAFASGTLTVVDVTKANFLQPAALNTVTSTSN